MPKLKVAPPPKEKVRPRPKPKRKLEYYDLFAWINRKKEKIGYAAFDAEKDMVRLKADAHLNPQKLGRFMINGDIQIESRKLKPKAIENNYKSAADEYDLPVRKD